MSEEEMAAIFDRWRELFTKARNTALSTAERLEISELSGLIQRWLNESDPA